MKSILWRFFMNIRHIYYCFLSRVSGDRFIFVKAWVKIRRGEYVHYNWGDELNAVMIGCLTKRKAILLPLCRAEKLFPIKSYMIIGSILTAYNLDRTTIWGTGIINNNEVGAINGKPEKICAVRGPKTQVELRKLGIECPEIYGDPALLMPRFYKASVKTRYTIGIIPHYIDLDNNIVEKLIRDQRIKLIKVQGYKKWTDFIDDICSCELILSSSLHGLIISEAYGIPSKWVKIGGYVDGWDFKYQDFYESIGKMNEAPFVMDETTDYEQMIQFKSKWEKGEIDLDKLMAACPIQ